MLTGVEDLLHNTVSLAKVDGVAAGADEHLILPGDVVDITTGSCARGLVVAGSREATALQLTVLEAIALHLTVLEVIILLEAWDADFSPEEHPSGELKQLKSGHDKPVCSMQVTLEWGTLERAASKVDLL